MSEVLAVASTSPWSTRPATESTAPRRASTSSMSIPRSVSTIRKPSRLSPTRYPSRTVMSMSSYVSASILLTRSVEVNAASRLRWSVGVSGAMRKVTAYSAPPSVTRWYAATLRMSASGEVAKAPAIDSNIDTIRSPDSPAATNPVGRSSARTTTPDRSGRPSSAAAAVPGTSSARASPAIPHSAAARRSQPPDADPAARRAFNEACPVRRRHAEAGRTPRIVARAGTRRQSPVAGSPQAAQHWKPRGDAHRIRAEVAVSPPMEVVP